MPQSKNNIFDNLKKIPSSSRKKFLSSFFGKENQEPAISKFKRENIDTPIIYVGAGTCGLAAGAGESLSEINKYLKENKIKAEIIEVGCIGFCSQEPLVDIQIPGKSRLCFGKATADKIYKILDSIFKTKKPEKTFIVGQFKNKETKKWPGISFMEEHPFLKKQVRFVLKNCGIINPLSIHEYVAREGYSSLLKAIHTMTPIQVADEIERSGLRGRGGGGFLTGRKWKIAISADSEQKYMICNADEGDPGAFMDRAVIEGDPHRVLEGLAIAAYAIAATKAYVYIRAEYPLAVKNLKIAIKEAKEHGLLGENIFDSGFKLDVIIKMGAGAFVCGEETALINSIEGKRGMPKPRPPYPAIKGLFGKPTIINNVETLANVPEIISQGSAFFSSIGTKNSKGTKVFALSGKIKRAGLVEVPMGTTLREIIFDIGDGTENNLKFKAVQIGGPSGGCIPESHLDTQVDYESLKSVGAIMGSGGLVVMDEKTCMVDVAKFFMSFVQKESCGKCIPCREGTMRMLEILKAITMNRKTEKDYDTLSRFSGIMELENLAKVIKETSLCGLGQTAPNPILSTLRWFKSEYEAHIFDRKCPAGVCTEMMDFSIDSDLCKGCGLCIKSCPVGAIVGKPGLAHYIISDKCISCGSCKAVCKFKAIKIS